MEENTMDFISELRAKSEKAENHRASVIAEIKSSFDRNINSANFEDYLKRRIGASDIKQRKTFMKVEFWEYHSGCSTTHFHCGGLEWYNPENREGWASHSYKGVELSEIDEEIGQYLSSLLENRMRELGFYVVSKENSKGRLGYYHYNYYFGW